MRDLGQIRGLTDNQLAMLALVLIMERLFQPSAEQSAVHSELLKRIFPDKNENQD